MCTLYSSLFSNPETGADPAAVAQPPSKQILPTSPEVLVFSPKDDVASPMNVEKMTSVVRCVEKKLKNCQGVSLSCNGKNKKAAISFPNCDVRDKTAALANADDCLNSLGHQSRKAKNASKDNN